MFSVVGMCMTIAPGSGPDKPALGSANSPFVAMILPLENLGETRGNKTRSRSRLFLAEAEIRLGATFAAGRRYVVLVRHDALDEVPRRRLVDAVVRILGALAPVRRA